MSHSLRSQIIKSCTISNKDEKKSFFMPFEEDENSQDVSLNKDTEIIKKDSQIPTIGSSIKIDGLDVVNFSMRVADTQFESASNDENIGTAEEEHRLQYLDKLLENNTLKSMISTTKLCQSNQKLNIKTTISHVANLNQNVEGISETALQDNFKDARINVERLKQIIEKMSETILILDEMLECIKHIKNWQNHLSSLNRCVLVLKKCLCDPSKSLLSIFQKSNQYVAGTKCHFIESKGTCLSPMIILQRAKNIPPQILKSIFFEVENPKLSLYQLEEIKVRYSFMLLFHMFNLELRRLFDLCLQNNCSEFGVLSCLEGFLWNAIEMDKSDLILRLDTKFWRWNNQTRLIDHLKINRWCNDILTRLDEKLFAESASCQNEDEILNIRDKYNLAKLFINEFNDAAISYRILPSTNDQCSTQQKNTVDRTLLLTRFANSLETQFTPLNYQEFQSHTVEQRSHLSQSINHPPTLSRASTVQHNYPNKLSPTQIHHKHPTWLHNFGFQKTGHVRHKILRSLHRLKDACSFWHKRKSSNKDNLRHQNISSPLSHGLRFHEEFQHTTFTDFENIGNRFSRLRDKKRSIMFKFFGED